MLVVPNSLASVEGNSTNSSPFNIGPPFPMRYQQVYAASQFGALAPAGEMITQIAFRLNDDQTTFSTTLPSIRIDMSTTSKAPDGLSNDPDNNVGADNIIVYGDADGEPLPLSSASVSGSPRNFDIVINLTTPFFYNPANGNLLLEVRNFAGGVTRGFDAENTSGDSVSRLVSRPTGTFRDSIGLVTRFTTTVIPEPGMVTLLVVGAVGLAVAAWRRRIGNQ